MPWEERARCVRYHDPELFFRPRARAERRAKAICAACEVRPECLRFALASKAEFGIWGGLSSRERLELHGAGAGSGRLTA